jgi:hypothetical protein
MRYAKYVKTMMPSSKNVETMFVHIIPRKPGQRILCIINKPTGMSQQVGNDAATWL